MTTIPLDTPEIYQFWGKSPTGGEGDLETYHLLVYHCLDVAAVGWTLLNEDSQLRERFTSLLPIPQDRLIRIVSLLLAVHDLGKCSIRFQNLAPDLLFHLQGRESTKPYTVRHDRMGTALLERKIWPLAWSENWFGLDTNPNVADKLDWRDVWGPCFRAIGGHHGSPQPSVDEFDACFDRTDLAGAESMARAFAILFDLPAEVAPLPYDPGLEEMTQRVSWLLAGFAVFCDWVGSDSTAFPFCSKVIPLDEYWERACTSARSALERFGLLPSEVRNGVNLDGLLRGRTPRPLQQAAGSVPLTPEPHLVVIEDVTGSGKTEAALILAYRLMVLGCADGFFFGLPTMATANAMFRRVDGLYPDLFDPERPPYASLAHSRGTLSREYGDRLGSSGNSSEEYSHDEGTASADCRAWLSDNRKKCLLAQVGIGTIDQALMAVLGFRHQSLRLLGLSRHVLIVDEVHAYDPYMRTILNVLLRFQGALGGSAVLLSATIPLQYRQEMIDSFLSGLGSLAVESIGERAAYPLLTICSQRGGVRYLSPVSESGTPGTQRRVEVELISSEETVIERLRETITSGRCACSIRNTVQDAQEAFDRIRTAIPEANVTLFHARFALGDRLDLEAEVLDAFGPDSTVETRKGRILVATQVVEQSLDLDFDLMVTDLAPMDLVIQRAGRLHRHDRGERGPARLVVLSPPLDSEPDAGWYASLFPRAAYVYPFRSDLWLTASMLTERQAIVVPDDARNLIEAVYGKGARAEAPAPLVEADTQPEGKERGAQAMAWLNALKLDEGYCFSGEAWGEETEVFTRLAEPSTTLLLVRWDGTTLEPWYSGEGDRWTLSECTVRRSKLDKPDRMLPDLQAAVEALTERLPDRGRYRTVMPLIRQDDQWVGLGKDTRGRSVVIHYDSREGLIFEKRSRNI